MGIATKEMQKALNVSSKIYSKKQEIIYLMANW